MANVIVHRRTHATRTNKKYDPIWIIPLSDDAPIAPAEAESVLAVDPPPAEPPVFLKSELPVVPAMARSLLRLELLLREPTLDLRAISNLIRSDLGLTIQTLRLVGADFDHSEDTPSRIQDSVVHLGQSALLLATPALRQGSTSNQAELAELWGHSRLVACWAERLAHTVGGLDPEKAYLGGLLHDIGSLPGLLRWHCREPTLVIGPCWDACSPNSGVFPTS